MFVKVFDGIAVFTVDIPSEDLRLFILQYNYCSIYV
jgi:hypothetical protein